MAGITKLLTTIRADFALFQQSTRKRFGAMQSELNELRTRLDALDTPVTKQTGAAAKKKAEASAPRSVRPVPVPDRPEGMVDAGVGQDPR